MPIASLRVVISSGVLLLAGTIFLALSYRVHARGVALDARGVETIAAVTRIVPDSDTDTGYLVEYDYQAAGARQTGRSRHVTAEDLAAAQRTGTLAIRYVPDDPGESAPARGISRRSLGVSGMVFGGLTLLAGIGLATLVLSTRMRTGRWWM